MNVQMMNSLSSIFSNSSAVLLKFCLLPDSMFRREGQSFYVSVSCLLLYLVTDVSNLYNFGVCSILFLVRQVQSFYVSVSCLIIQFVQIFHTSIILSSAHYIGSNTSLVLLCFCLVPDFIFSNRCLKHLCLVLLCFCLVFDSIFRNTSHNSLILSRGGFYFQ